MAELQSSRSTATRRAGDELETLLVNESVYTAILLASSAVDDVGSHMLRIAWANDKAMALLTKISLPAELRVSEESLLLRQDSPHTTALKEFVVLYGGSYLRKILRHAIQTLAKRGAQYEIDPLRVEGGSLEKNMANLRSDTEFLLNEILNSFATFPSELSLLFRALYDQVEARFPNAGYRAMGAVFFLRLACPMMVGPTTSGVLKSDEPVSPALQRGLLLMTKVITSIANESASFDKEECMRPLSDVVARSIPLVHNFYDLVLRAEIFRPQSPAHDANAMEQNVSSRTRYKVMEPYLVTVTQFIHRNEERIRGELAKLMSQEAAEALMEQIFSASLSLQQRLERRANNPDGSPNSNAKRRNSMAPATVSPLVKPLPLSSSSTSLASLVSSSAAAESSVPRTGGSAVMSRDPNAVALSEVLTRLTASSADETAMNAFYYSYRYFVPPIDVINWLLKRHSTPPPVLSTSELLRYKNDVEIPQRLRIAKFVENWLRAVPSELADPEIASILTNYSNTLRNCGMTTNGSNLGSQIATILAKLKTADAKSLASAGGGGGGVEFGSSPHLPSTAISPPAPSPLGITLGAASPLLSLSASDLAAELASIAYERVRALTPSALCAIMQWAPLSAPENPVVPLIKHVNALHRWVCVSVAHPSTSPKERASLLSHACKLASESRKAGDWLSSTAIAYGIMSGVLVLPQKEAEKVPKSVREMIKINKKDHAKARVPWVAPYLQRLVDSLGPTSPKMVNWDLMVQIGTTISELLSAVPPTSPYVSAVHLRPRILCELAPPAPPSPTRLQTQPHTPTLSAEAVAAAPAGAMLPHSVSAGALSSTATKPVSGLERGASTSQLSLSDAHPVRRASLQPTMPAGALVPLPLLRYAVTRMPRVASLPAAASPTVLSSPMQPRSLSTPTPPSIVNWADMIRPDDATSGRRSPAPSMTSEDSNWDCTSDSSISGDARLAADADFFDH